MKIAYIAIKGLPMSGGIEKYTDDIASMLAKRGHDITVYTTKHYGNRSGEYHGYKIKAIPSWRIKSLEKITLVFHASIHQMFHKYDIAHYHALGPSIFAFMAKMTGKRVIIQSHGIEYQRSKWGKFAQFNLRTMEKLSYNQGHALTVVSKTLQKHFYDCYGKESIFIPTAVELPVEKECDLTAFTKEGLQKDQYYLFMARIVKEKGLHYLIPAFKEAHLDRQLVIAGKMDANDPYHQEILEMAKDCPNILFVGEVLDDKKDQLFRGAYAFMQPSELEGLSVALLEAMSYKKCCIVSDIPENLEASADHCIAFKTQDVSSLKEALVYADQNESIVKERGELAYAYVKEHHQLTKIVDQIEAMYQEVLSQKKSKKKKKEKKA